MKILLDRKASKPVIILSVAIPVASWMIVAIYHTSVLDQPLWIAVQQGNIAEVKKLLKRGADPNVQWEDGTSALQVAERRGNIHIIKLLVQAGAKN